MAQKYQGLLLPGHTCRKGKGLTSPDLSVHSIITVNCSLRQVISLFFLNVFSEFRCKKTTRRGPKRLLLSLVAEPGDEDGSDNLQKAGHAAIPASYEDVNHNYKGVYGVMRRGRQEGRLLLRRTRSG